LAATTFGYSPAMLEHLLDEALVWALRRGSDSLGWEDIARAKMTEELGLAQPVSYTEEERRRIATHESGHAAVAWLVSSDRKLEVLSIIKRRSALGLLAHSETEERWTRTQSELEDLIRVAMGGMVAEELFFGETSSGVSGDLVAATEAAAQMVGSFGMGGSLVSLDAMRNSSSSNVVAKVLADEFCRRRVEGILEGARADVRRLLRAYAYLVEALRDSLLEREELIGEEITDVLHHAAPHRVQTPAPAPEMPPVVDLREVDGVDLREVGAGGQVVRDDDDEEVVDLREPAAGGVPAGGVPAGDVAAGDVAAGGVAAGGVTGMPRRPVP
jgi:ATP-dependent Zn protease